METIKILKVSIMDDGCLGIFPESENPAYQYVYRAAAGVTWDKDRRCFMSPPVREWSAEKWYQQIVTVVKSELGLQLAICPGTEYEPDQEEFERSIKLADQKL